MCAYALVCAVHNAPKLYKCPHCGSVEVEFCAEASDSIFGKLCMDAPRMDAPLCVNADCPFGKQIVKNGVIMCCACLTSDGRGAKNRVHVGCSDGRSGEGHFFFGKWVQVNLNIPEKRVFRVEGGQDGQDEHDWYVR